MKKVINIYSANNKLVLDARDLYSNLEIGRDFSTWIRSKIKTIGLIVNEDYITTIVSKSVGRPTINYEITVDTAKRILSTMRVNEDTVEILNQLSSTGSIETGATKVKKVKPRTRKVKHKEEATENVIELNNDTENTEIMVDPIQNVSKVYNDMFGEIRYVSIENKPYFVAYDIAKSLGYKNVSRDVQRHCVNVLKAPLQDMEYQNGTSDKKLSQEWLLIAEGDIYRLITKSKLPAAIKFERWLFDDIMPSIRKHGFYATTSTVERLLNDPDAAIALFESYKKEQAEKKALLEEKVNNAPKLMAYDDFISSDGLYSFSATAKMIAIPRTATSKTLIGRNTLLAWLRRDGVLMSSGEERNTPYQRFISQGLFEVKPINDEESLNRMTVRVTPKGIEWLYRKYKYSNMPNKIEISDIEDNDEDYLDTAM